MKQQSWHALSVQEVFKALQSRPSGLTTAAVKKRITQGKNTIPEAKQRAGWIIFFSQFKGALTILLVIAACVSWLVGETSDATIIGITVLVTVIFGFIQEYRAEQAFALLRSMLHPVAHVIRGGEELEVPLSDVVVGDVLVLTAGSSVPADARLFEAQDLEVIEAELTGESVPSTKSVEVVPEGVALADRKNVVFQGTVVASGEAKAVVVATGSETEFARIAQKLGEVVEVVTPLQQNLRAFVRWLTMVVGVMIAILFAVALLRGVDVVLSLETAIAVAVATIPEGLVISVTAMLALGARQMLKSDVLIRHLLAVETLGAVTVICTDKTGTLTEGKMDVVEVIAEDEQVLAEALYFGSSVRVSARQKKVSDWTLFGSPTEQALFRWSLGQDGIVDEERRNARIDVMPFKSEHKYSATMYEEGGKRRVYVIGAPERVLAAAGADGRLMQSVEAWAQEGKRVIAAATALVDAQSFDDIDDVLALDLQEVGLVAIADPLRDTVVDAIKNAQNAGVRVIMITGDNAQTALTIARAAGIHVNSGMVLEGSQVQEMSDKDLKKSIQSISVFARISPTDKLRIVNALQSQREVVAMTGDGINDAAALKKAEIGVAVGTAHDIAKESSDMVILHNDFASIVEAISGGRRIYANVQKVVTFLLYGGFTTAVLILFSLLFGLPLPLLPAQILWVNIIEDVAPGLAFVFEPAEGDQMKRPPRSTGDDLLQPVSRTMIFGAGIIASIVMFVIYWWLLLIGFDLIYARTVAFALIGVDTFFTAFALKSLSQPVWRISPFNNMVLVWSLFGSYTLYGVALYVPFFRDMLEVAPLDAFGWGVVFLAGCLNLFFVEIVKWLYRRQDRLL